MDPNVLLQSKGDDAPSGENLEYDSIFVDMELAAQPGEDSQFGGEASDPDYSAVKAAASEVLEKSHDLRAAVFLADALLNTDGMVGFANVTTFIRGCLEEYWDSCHPQLDEDDDDDPVMRINAIQGLAGQPDGIAGASPVYRSLRRAALTNSRGFGRFSLRDIEIAEGAIPAPDGMENVPDTASVSAAFQDTDGTEIEQVLAAILKALEDVRAISAVFDEKTPGQGPDLDALIKQLFQMSRHVAAYAGTEVASEDAGEGAESDEDQAAPAQASGASGGGAVNSRTDVTAALERIVAYYVKHEPSSPLPILLERAKRLVNADFMTIMQDIAPGGLDNVRMLKGDD